jgi:hypothetical protein
MQSIFNKSRPGPWQSPNRVKSQRHRESNKRREVGQESNLSPPSRHSGPTIRWNRENRAVNPAPFAVPGPASPISHSARTVLWGPSLRVVSPLALLLSGGSLIVPTRRGPGLPQITRDLAASASDGGVSGVMGNCCSDETGHAGAHSVGPAAADRFLRSKGAGASTQIEVRSLSSHTSRCSVWSCGSVACQGLGHWHCARVLWW